MMKKIILLFIACFLYLFTLVQPLSCGTNTTCSSSSNAFAAPFVIASSQDSVLVCNSKNAYAYHTHYCSGLSRCGASVSKITQSQAESRGYRACKFCY